MFRRRCISGHSPTSILAIIIGVVMALHVADDGAIRTASASAHVLEAVKTEVVIEERFAVQPGEMLAIRVSDADVSVQTGTDDEVHIRVLLESNDMNWARKYFERQGYRIEQVDGEVRLVAEPKKGFRFAWDVNKRASIRVLVTTPKTFDVDLKTSDGYINLGNLRGNASLRTSDGDIIVLDLEGERVQLKTSDGDIKLGKVTADRIAVQTSDGDIETGNIQCDGEAEFRSSDGTLLLAQIHAATVSVRTSDGDIHIDELIANRSEVRTSDGSIKILHLEGDLEAASSDADLSVGLYKPGRILLKSSNGDITITAPASLPADLSLRGDPVRIASAFRYEGDVKEERADGRIGGGGPRLEARTSDGSVTLRPIN